MKYQWYPKSRKMDAFEQELYVFVTISGKEWKEIKIYSYHARLCADSLSLRLFVI